MKAAVYRSFGPADVVSAEEVPTPVPRDGEVLVRVHAATVGVVDSLARRGAPWYARSQFGLRRPRFPVLGSDFAGQVEAVGRAVRNFRVGEEVFGTRAPRFGAHAEYVCLPEDAALAPGRAELRRDLRRGRPELVPALSRGAQRGRRVPDDRAFAGDPAADAVDGTVREP